MSEQGKTGSVTARQGHLVRMTVAGGQLRAAACITTPVIEEARRRHHLWPTAAAALGRLMTASVLLASSLKDDERIMLQIIGDGPLRHLVAEATARLEVRGYAANPHVHLPLNDRHKLDVAGAVGKGDLYVMRDLGLKEPYRGAVPLASGEIAEDVAYYLAYSEQTPASVALGVLVSEDGSIRAAGGWLVTPLPGAPSELVEEVARRLRQAPAVSRTIDELGQGASARGLIEGLLGDLDVRVLATAPVAFRCPCTRQRMDAGLVALGAQELRDLASEQDPVELRCRFCNRRYLFSAKRLRQLADRAERPALRAVKNDRSP
ncbi:MAG: Hsp33 family molecular chaperone HslO [Bacillota bacterium]